MPLDLVIFTIFVRIIVLSVCWYIVFTISSNGLANNKVPVDVHPKSNSTDPEIIG